MKRCPSCCEVKPLEDFYRLARSKDGHQGYCKVCANQKRRDWGKANPEREGQWARAEAARRSPRQRKDKGLRAKFRMTADDYDLMLAAQGGGCAACGTPPGTTALHVDHDHACCPSSRRTCGGCVRGLLCFTCNAALGNVNDSKERLMKLIEYLTQNTLDTDAAP